MSRNGDKKPVGFATQLTAGGTAGAMEALCCQPLDTIKVRMQLSRSGRAPGTKARGFIATGALIVQRETPLALYKGLGAVLSGIVPKMAIRFASFETYKGWLADKETGKTNVGSIFIAGLGAGTTEAVFVVTPMEVVKIRLQAQQHSLADPLETPQYRNAGHAVYKIVREEGAGALYRGVTLTALRQATNQGANFTAYQELKKLAHSLQPELADLPSYQHMAIGLVSGAMGPSRTRPSTRSRPGCRRRPPRRAPQRGSGSPRSRARCGVKRASARFTRASRRVCSASRPGRRSCSRCTSACGGLWRR